MPWEQVVSWYPSWRHELVNDRCPMNSAGTAGPIRTRDGSFDAPERRNDDGGGHARGAACHLARATCRRVNPSKNVVSGLQPKREVAVSPNFQVRSALVWIVCQWENQPRGVKLVPPGGNFIFSAFCPLARTPLNLGTPNLVHGSTWARAIRIFIIWWVQKLGDQNFGCLEFFDFFFVFFFLSS